VRGKDWTYVDFDQVEIIFNECDLHDIFQLAGLIEVESRLVKRLENTKLLSLLRVRTKL